MLIDCDTCTVRGGGCDDCVVTVLLGAPPGWLGSDPTVVPLPGRLAVCAAVDDRVAVDLGDTLVSGPGRVYDTPGRRGRLSSGTVVDLDDVERRAVRVLADVGLVPPLRHQSPPSRDVG